MSETESDIAASDIVASTSSSTSGSASASTEITEPHQADHVVASACSSALLDGKFYRIISVDKDNGAVKAVCVNCPDGKRPLSGSLTATTNFLTHLKVCNFCVSVVTLRYKTYLTHEFLKNEK